MERAFDFITFDCYGTLIDWETGISQAFIDAAGVDGVGLEREAILKIHAEVEPAIQQGPYRGYREVLRNVALQAAERLGWRLDPDRAGFLAQSLPSWIPFPDVNPALERMKGAGCRLGILSNIDDQLLAATLKHFPVEFDLLVTAEQVRSYKPAHRHFLEARERIGEARWLHAAQSYFHDVEPARALDIAVAWVNRKSERPTVDARLDVEVRSLSELVDWLGIGSASPR